MTERKAKARAGASASASASASATTNTGVLRLRAACFAQDDGRKPATTMTTATGTATATATDTATATATSGWGGRKGSEGISGGTFGRFTGWELGGEPTLKLVWVSLIRVGLVRAAAFGARWLGWGCVVVALPRFRCEQSLRLGCGQRLRVILRRSRGLGGLRRWWLGHSLRGSRGGHIRAKSMRG